MNNKFCCHIIQSLSLWGFCRGVGLILVWRYETLKSLKVKTLDHIGAHFSDDKEPFISTPYKPGASKPPHGLFQAAKRSRVCPKSQIINS